jgi:hypothetical protein
MPRLLMTPCKSSRGFVHIVQGVVQFVKFIYAVELSQFPWIYASGHSLHRSHTSTGLSRHSNNLPVNSWRPFSISYNLLIYGFSMRWVVSGKFMRQLVHCTVCIDSRETRGIPTASHKSVQILWARGPHSIDKIVFKDPWMLRTCHFFSFGM